jgi:hypothetical protein
MEGQSPALKRELFSGFEAQKKYQSFFSVILLTQKEKLLYSVLDEPSVKIARMNEPA